MKISEKEMKALFDWSTAELDRIEKEFPYVGELDGYGVVAQKAHFAEYNRRLDLLKAKAQTFNQVRHAVAN